MDDAERRKSNMWLSFKAVLFSNLSEADFKISLLFSTVENALSSEVQWGIYAQT